MFYFKWKTCVITTPFISTKLFQWHWRETVLSPLLKSCNNQIIWTNFRIYWTKRFTTRLNEFKFLHQTISAIMILRDPIEILKFDRSSITKWKLGSIYTNHMSQGKLENNFLDSNTNDHEIHLLELINIWVIFVKIKRVLINYYY